MRAYTTGNNGWGTVTTDMAEHLTRLVELTVLVDIRNKPTRGKPSLCCAISQYDLSKTGRGFIKQVVV